MKISTNISLKNQVCLIFECNLRVKTLNDIENYHGFNIIILFYCDNILANWISKNLCAIQCTWKYEFLLVSYNLISKREHKTLELFLKDPERTQNLLIGDKMSIGVLRCYYYDNNLGRQYLTSMHPQYVLTNHKLLISPIFTDFALLEK